MQDQFAVTVEQLALAPELLISYNENIERGAVILPTLISEWSSAAPSLSDMDKQKLRDLFGESFLTERYYLATIFEIPA